MQYFNHNSIYREMEKVNRHWLEKLVLQGRMSTMRTGTVISLQGPHDVIQVTVELITPSGIHTLRLREPAWTCHGTFREWNKEWTKPNQEQQRLIHKWKLENNTHFDLWCKRKHRNAREAKSCNGLIKPVTELSDPPRRVPPRSAGSRKGSQGQRPRKQGIAIVNRTPVKRRYVPILPRPSANVFHFKA